MRSPSQPRRGTGSAYSDSATPKVCLIGSSHRFLSGISIYTRELAAALAGRFSVSVVLMRQLIPTRYYPGRTRVGSDLTRLDYAPDVAVFDGVDWFWGLSILRCLRFLRCQVPDFVVLEWWTGAVLHTYLLIAITAKMWGADIIIEFHEVQDVGEQKIPFVGGYVSRVFPLLLRLVSGSVVHSEHDRIALEQLYGTGLGIVKTLPHAPYEFHGSVQAREAETGATDVTHLLYFGVIRPFKGVDDLILAFNMLSPSEVERYELTIIGETWEGFDVGALVASSPYRDRINFINRYVHDDELADSLRNADVVVLPYHRSASSGPLSLAMGSGLPVIVTRVGGLAEAAEGYDGAFFVDPHEAVSLRDAMLHMESLRGQRFQSNRSWQLTVAGIEDLFAQIAEAKPK